MNSIKIVISAKSIVFLFALVIFAWIFYQSKEMILLLFASFIFASALYPVVDWLNKRMSRGYAVFTVYSLGFIILATVLIPFVVIIIHQTQEFLRQLHGYWIDIESFIRDFQINIKDSNLMPNFYKIFSNTANIGENILSQSINITVNVFTGLAAAITLATIVLFLLLDKQELKKGFLCLFPTDMREKAEIISSNISIKVGGYIRGQLIIMVITGLMTTAGLMLVGIDFSLLLGLLARLLEIIPIVGPVSAATIAAIVALAKSPMASVWVIVVFVVVQTIQNRILTPIIFGKFLDIHPLLIIISLLITANTLGLPGVILSPAIAAAVYIIVQELYIKRINTEN